MNTKEYNRQYYLKHKEEIKARSAEWKKNNKERASERHKEYYEKNKEAINNLNKRYRDEHKEEIAKYRKQYNAEHKDEIAERKRQWWCEHREQQVIYKRQKYATINEYCRVLLHSYERNDKKYMRIGDTLPKNYITLDYLINAVQQPDHYDGKQYEFNEMGLDRIDNSKPHTLDNVVPCSTMNNRKRHLMPYDEFKKLF